jgi:hypothetical protein
MISFEVMYALGDHVVFFCGNSIQYPSRTRRFADRKISLVAVG